MGNLCSSAAAIAGVEDVNNDGKIDHVDIIAAATSGGRRKKRRTTGNTPAGSRRASALGGGGGGGGGRRRSSAAASSSSMLDLNGDGKVDYKDAIAGVQKVRKMKKRSSAGNRAGAGGGGAAMVGSLLSSVVGGASGSGGGSKTSSYQPDQVMTSSCDGEKKALYIGINYVGTSSELRGCHNDVRNVKDFVEEHYGFSNANSRVLMDDGSHELPTRKNMLAAMAWLVNGARKGDSLLLHYSGHGGSSRDESGLEADGMAETLCPSDYSTAGQIVDDDVHAVLTKNLPEGVRLTAIMDCCHSGTVLDLPYLYNLDASLSVQEVDIRSLLLQGLASVGSALLAGNKARAAEGAISTIMQVMSAKGGGDKGAAERAERLKSTNADVIQFSGCRDDQTSADAHIGGEATGAMSYALLKALKEKGTSQTYTELLTNVHHILGSKYSQRPQLTSGRKLNMKVPFKM